MRWVILILLSAAAAVLWHGWYAAWLMPLSAERVTAYLSPQAPLDRKLLALRQLQRTPAARPELSALARSPIAEVRYRAAIILAALGDKSAGHILKEMESPYTLYSPYTGQLVYRVKKGEAVSATAIVAQVGDHEIQATLTGTVRALYEDPPGVIRTGQRLLDITPDLAEPRR